MVEATPTQAFVGHCVTRLFEEIVVRVPGVYLLDVAKKVQGFASGSYMRGIQSGLALEYSVGLMKSIDIHELDVTEYKWIGDVRHSDWNEALKHIYRLDEMVIPKIQHLQSLIPLTLPSEMPAFPAVRRVHRAKEIVETSPESQSTTTRDGLARYFLDSLRGGIKFFDLVFKKMHADGERVGHCERAYEIKKDIGRQLSPMRYSQK
jgi:hypothetical protein